MFLLLRKSHSTAGLLLLNSRYAFAAPQLGEHVLGREAVPGQHDQAVKPQVGTATFRHCFPMTAVPELLW